MNPPLKVYNYDQRRVKIAALPAETRHTVNLKLLSRALLLGLSLIGLTWLSLGQVQRVSQAQGSGPIALTKVLNRSGNVVRVGEVLSFTIALTNNSAFTLTGVTLIDTYDQTTLAFAGATPPESSVDPGTGTIRWDNVAASPILPGQSIALTVVFTAEHPKTAIVNAVRAQDIIHESGQLTETAETSRTQEAIGGSAPIVKFLAPGATPQAGLPVTFTHIITNDGAALMTFLPLTDTYDPAFLEFRFAIPTPTLTSPPGLIAWADLTDYFGAIQPFATVVVTTVFSATTQVLNTVNQASTEGARDLYDNDLTAGQAQVPITIIDSAPTRTPEDNDNNNDNDNDNEDNQTPLPTPTPVAPTAAAVATLAAAAQATSTAIPANGPRFLPETGELPWVPFLFLSLALMLLIGGWYAKKIQR